MALVGDPRENMIPDTETELLGLLSSNSPDAIKGLAVHYLLGMTGTAEGCSFIGERKKLFVTLLNLMFSPNTALRAEAEKCVLNLTADEKLVTALLKIKEPMEETVFKLLQRCVDVEQSCNMTLSVLGNLTRVSDGAELVANVVVEKDSVGLKKLVDVIIQLYEKKALTLGATCKLLMNLTQVSTIRQALMLPPDHLLLRLLALMSLFSSSLAPIKGVVGAVKNCCFEYEFHSWLLKEENNFLSHILLPLSGPEEFDEEDMDRLPLDLQYLPSDKQREPDAEIRLMLVQTLHKMLSTKSGRLYLKDKNVYVIMRELHKAETVEDNITEIMNVIDILIGDEPEEGMEELHKIDIPHHLKEKFEREDLEERENVDKTQAELSDLSVSTEVKDAKTS